MAKKNSIFRQILIPVIFVMVLLLSSVLGTVLKLFTSFYVEQVLQNTAEASDSIAQNAQSYISGMYKLSEEICANEDIKSMETARQTPVLVNAALRNPEVQLFYVQDANGDQTGRSSGSLGNRKNRWWFVQIEKTHKPFVSSSYYSVSTSAPCVSIFQPLLNGDELYGVFGIDMSLESIQSMVERFSKNKLGRYSFVIDGEGVVTAHPDSKFVEELYNYKTLKKQILTKNPDGTSVFDEKGNPVVAEKDIEISGSLKNIIPSMLSGDNGTVEAEIDGRKAFISFRPLHFEGDSEPWIVVTVQPKKEAFSIFIKVIVISVVVGVFVLALAIFVVMLVSKRIVGQFQSNLSGKLRTEIQNLVHSSKETASISQDQNAAVKEIVATMEDSNALSGSIAVKIKDVTRLAGKTSSDVLNGVAALDENVRQLHEIFSANQDTMDGIKLLSEKIENIWDIVSLINSVADQAKIIAFNAELEAANAGEAGKNFHIVASEIRRLADGIIDGTKEIKEKITEIQENSDTLMLASESGTEKINRGCEVAKNLEEKFNSIKISTEITAKSNNDITEIIQQQSVSSQQILMTLKQIASGVENCSDAANRLSDSAEILKSIADDLSE